MRIGNLLIKFVLALAGLTHLSMAQGADYALTNINVFNGFDERIVTGATVLVSAGKIERVATGAVSIPAGYTSIDGEGNFLMPGMIDVHTHISSLAGAQRALESGVTTVRSASVAAFQDVSIGELARSGQIAGPDIIPAGVFVTPDLGESLLADTRLGVLADGVNSDDELRLLVNINIDRGAKVIKTRGTQRAGLPDTDPRQQVYTEQQLRVVVEEAAKRGVPVMVHAHGDEGARAAVLAGARSIEHGTYLSDETIRLMKEMGTWLVPTYITMAQLNEEKNNYVLRLRGSHMTPRLESAFVRAHRSGVKIATGADNYYQAESINRISLEVAHFVRMGMSEFDALQSATTVAAELLMLQDRTGRIAAGYEADMILVPMNPLEDVTALQDVLLVMSNGQLAVKRIPFGIED